jgi:hypothetical protein
MEKGIQKGGKCMKTKRMNVVAALMAIITFTLPGAFIGAEKLIKQGIARVAQGRSTSYDSDEFLTRYYDKGASAGSSWETLVDKRD